MTFVNSPAGWSKRATLWNPYEAVGWSREGQRDRFEAILDALAPRPGETLLDFGCGLGALADWLDPRIRYIGYDWAPGMIARAQIEHADRTFRHTLPPDRQFDLTVCCGTFNLPGSKQVTWQQLRALWDNTLRALAVSLYAGDDPVCLSYTVDETEAFAARESSKWVLVRDRPNDLLLVMRKTGQPPS